MGLSKHCWSTRIPSERAANSARSFSAFESVWRSDPDFVQIRVQPHPVPAGSLQILGGAHKGAGTIVHGLAKGAEVSSGLGHQENQRLLSLLRHGNEDTLVARFPGPGFYAGEPVGRRGIGGPAQEGDDQDVMRRLALGEIGVDPKTVAGEQIGNLAHRKRDLAPLDVYINFGSGQIERRAVSP